ncbi:MAG: hypothetical protein UY18_C0049G0002 [Microgenomates group bacterium GW2011_GWF2_47_9]|nr:MAG: hypothetical protein UY18_C0049G0002 [Microgenomates group bacterium GW2011_GWF2_47_9]
MPKKTAKLQKQINLKWLLISFLFPIILYFAFRQITVKPEINVLTPETPVILELSPRSTTLNKVGEDISLTVLLRPASFHVTGAEVEIKYDSSSLSYKGTKVNSLLPTVAVKPSASEGIIKFTLLSDIDKSPADGPGELATLTFTLKKKTPSLVRFTVNTQVSALESSNNVLGLLKHAELGTTPPSNDGQSSNSGQAQNLVGQTQAPTPTPQSPSVNLAYPEEDQAEVESETSPETVVYVPTVPVDPTVNPSFFARLKEYFRKLSLSLSTI